MPGNTPACGVGRLDGNMRQPSVETGSRHERGCARTTSTTTKRAFRQQRLLNREQAPSSAALKADRARVDMVSSSLTTDAQGCRTGNLREEPERDLGPDRRWRRGTEREPRRRVSFLVTLPLSLRLCRSE